MDTPRAQYLSAGHVLESMASFGTRRLQRSTMLQLLVLAVLAGVFISAGALFSILLTIGVEAAGPAALLAGIGFSTGFFIVVLSEAALFTEANVVMPAVLLEGRVGTRLGRIVMFWVVVAIGNLLGSILFGAWVAALQPYGPEFVTANFQHAPANMGYFGLATPLGLGPGWGTALAWNVVPAGIGNMIGGTVLVALPFWYALHPRRRQDGDSA